MRHPEKGHPIYVQIVHDQRLIIISRGAMQEYFQRRDIQARQVFEGLINHFNAREKRHTLGAGTALAQTQERCFEIPVPIGHAMLEEMLTAYGEPVSDA